MIECAKGIRPDKKNCSDCIQYIGNLCFTDCLECGGYYIKTKQGFQCIKCGDIVEKK